MEQQSAGMIASFFPFILIFIVFYFLLIRPQQKQRKEHEEMLKTLAKNDEVVTTGGVHGTIVNVKETTVVLRIDDNAKLEIEKYAVAQIKKKRSAAEAAQ